MPTTRPPQRRALTTTPAALAPSGEMQQMRNRIRHFFDAPFGRLMQEPFFADLLTEPVGWMPAVEVSETDAEYVATVELPGMQRDDVHVEFENGVLTIEGQKQEERKEEKEGRQHLVWERTYGRFQRSFGFPGVDDARITAEMRAGVLTVKLPKMAEAKPKGRRIVITNGK
ncbi:MAG TPA: Hsp20/alpha crystallin family protein [Gemmatimonadaceae bacterium]|nr:Hsp20/alpha crystallin family protein [Gemmatimonadaceae bacterium]